MKKLLLLIFLFSFPITLTANAEGWGFTKNNSHDTPYIGRYSELIKGTDSYYVGDITKNEVYLTFDVGYDNGNLSPILETLEKKNVRATFFVTGDFVKRYPELITRLSFSNHVICSHSYSHKSITKLSKSELGADLERLQTEYYNLTGKQLSMYFRPPEGVFDTKSLLNIKELGYKTVFWSVAWKDWVTDKQRGAEFSYDSYVKNLHNGAIILMHTVSSSNKDALERIIDYTIQNGYTFKTVEAL